MNTKNKVYWLSGLALIVAILIIITTMLLSFNGAVISSNDIEVVRIGAALSLTGKGASFGENIMNGINMAVEEVNKEDKIYLNVIYEDTQTDPNQAVSAVTKLINVDGLSIILGPVSSGNFLAVAPIAESNKVILFTPISSAEDITNAGDFIFRNRETATLHGKSMAEYLYSEGFRKTAVFASQSPNSLSYSEAFIKEYGRLGGETELSQYNEGTLDFRTFISKALTENPDAIYITPSTGVDAGLLTKQIRELGFNGVITAATTIESDEFIETAGVFSEGVIITSPAFNLDSPEIQEYRLKYKSKYGKESDPFAANAYDAVHILADAIESCNGDDSVCIKNYLYSVRNYPGVGGKTSFDHNGDVIKPVAMKEVRSGKFEIIS